MMHRKLVLKNLKKTILAKYPVFLSSNQGGESRNQDIIRNKIDEQKLLQTMR